MDYESRFTIGDRVISNSSPTYFIADIGANHDGQLSRAKELIKLAKDAGADCAKFQHFKAEKIVSAVGFEGVKSAHQRGWSKSVFEVYADASINPEWNSELHAAAMECGIDFMTTPYDFQSVNEVDCLVKAFKIGSGDITYPQLIRHIAMKGKPVFLATGASSLGEVSEAVDHIIPHNRRLCLLQCNTNYTGDLENFRHVNLKVLRTFAEYWPDMPLGLSDHTPGHAAVLGAVALGACVIEKHFTDDCTRKGPDHAFALDTEAWWYMVQATRQLEMALGDGIKRVEDNEIESRVVQRRAIRLTRDVPRGSRLVADHIEMLRPCPRGAYTPADATDVVGYVLNKDKAAGEVIYPEDLI